MDMLQLLTDLHLEAERQGPGDAEHTRLALRLAGLAGRPGLDIADIGCGTGAASLVLAEELDARITAVDLLPAFLAELDRRAARAGLSGRIDTHAASMEELPFADASLDAIWSEGAIYNVGFEAGLHAWRRFLRPGGILAVSELTWLTNDRPAGLSAHWAREYPQVATAGEKVAQIQAAGYGLRGYFPLSPACWLAAYYEPLEARFSGFLDRHADSAEAQEIVAAERAEIALYRAHSAHVSYGFYIAQKLP